MSLHLPQLAPHSLTFPPVSQALIDPDGLLAFGGDLSPNRIVRAYKAGIFPWYSPGEPILWWSPSTRAIITERSFHLSKSLRKCLRKTEFVVTLNHAPQEVIEACANTRAESETWITDEMIDAYCQLSDLGLCHSVEVWHKQQLVGGLYGLSVGGVFCGESMFSTMTNASKVGFAIFQHHFFMAKGQLIDCQLENPHLMSLGALLLPREDFIATLAQHCEHPLDSSFYTSKILTNPWSLG
jgi:leucyl/phenylalanyl-tRNA--protein transferase